MDVRVGLERKLSTEELMLLNCGVGEDIWESPALKEIQPVHPKDNQSVIFAGGTDAEVKTPIIWPPDAKNRLIRKDLDAANDWGQKENGTTEDGLDVVSDVIDIRLSRFQQLMMERAAQCAAESGTTEQLNWTDHRVKFLYLRIMYLRVCM